MGKSWGKGWILSCTTPRQPCSGAGKQMVGAPLWSLDLWGGPTSCFIWGHLLTVCGTHSVGSWVMPGSLNYCLIAQILLGEGPIRASPGDCKLYMGKSRVLMERWQCGAVQGRTSPSKGSILPLHRASSCTFSLLCSPHINRWLWLKYWSCFFQGPDLNPKLCFIFLLLPFSDTILDGLQRRSYDLYICSD